MVEIMLTGTIVIIGNGWLLVYLLNNKKKLERELEIYKNRLDNIISLPIHKELKKYGIKINKVTKKVESILNKGDK